MSETLEQHIWTIKEHLDLLKEQYLSSEKPTDKKDYTLFNKVKEETGPLFELIEEWYQEAERFLKQIPQPTVFPLQLQNTKDNFELVLLHSYYIDVKKKRYMELYHSIHFVLNQLLDDINRTTSSK
ncbi:DUF1798 family protein [Pontibacillus salicampi]|uniref:DUF1798 family protein n=1 Tax=Pontibacillus salicampi TaxID=1449801 RepID=A0ABV6LLC7_9BACI